MAKKLLEHIEKEILQHCREIREYAAKHNHSRPCPINGPPHKIDLEASIKLSWQKNEPRLVYAPCSRCASKSLDVRIAENQMRCGVPKKLLNARMSNWKPRSPQDEKVLATVQAFSAGDTKFTMLLLHGTVGTGKSHLAAGIMAADSRTKLMITQRAFISRLRRRYSDNNADDIINRCKKVKLLVLDELEIPAGGRDELPALHEVFYHRFDDADPMYGKSEHLLTVFTTNLTLDELRDALGDRIIDRLRECAVICELTGRSMRGAK